MFVFSYLGESDDEFVPKSQSKPVKDVSVTKSVCYAHSFVDLFGAN